jgi:hypothetical protein
LGAYSTGEASVKDIEIHFIPQEKQRYHTVGDWGAPWGIDTVRATRLSNDDHSFLIAIHELVEMYLCQRDCVSQQVVDEWDMNYDGGGEPGEHPNAPYKWQHQRAETVERVLAEILGVDWGFYQKEIDRALEGG